MRKFLLAAAAMLLCAAGSAQNIQLHYDFGHSIYKTGDKNISNRPELTTTAEMFKPDAFGSTFFFVDLDYAPSSNKGVVGAYWEIARELCFWKGTDMEWLSAHVEYNGGMNQSVSYDSDWLFGATYSGHSADFSKTWSLSALYKYIPRGMNLDGTAAPNSFQITAVWGITFAQGWCTFSGFVDFWREPRSWQGTEFITISEPQFWVNLNKAEALKNVNLSVGGEVEISNNFVDKGFYAIPTLGLKWTF